MKRILMLMLVVILSAMFPLSAFADSESDDGYEAIISDVNSRLDGIGGDDAEAFLDDNGITVDSPETIAALAPDSVFDYILSLFKEEITAPVKLLGKLIAAAAVCALIKSLNPSPKLETSFTMVSTLVCILIVSNALTDSVQRIITSLDDINEYMTAYIPVFTGVSTASGNAVSAAGYYAVMFFVCELMVYISSKLLMPLISCVLAMSLVSAIDPAVGIGKAAESIKGFVVKALSFIMIIFTALVSITGLSGSAADSLGAKTVKFAASSFIPVIGGSVSEAYSAVKSSLGAIRTSVGMIGVITVAVIVLRPMIAVIAMRIIVAVAKLIHEMFSLDRSSAVLSGISSVLAIAMSIAVAYALFFIVATSVILLTATG